MGTGRPGPDPGKVKRAAELRGQGLSDRQVGRELGTDGRTVARWLGPREPGTGPDGRFTPTGTDGAEAARLHDEDGLSWRAAGERLGVSHETARRAARGARPADGG